jgi:hypothetical protein
MGSIPIGIGLVSLLSLQRINYFVRFKDSPLDCIQQNKNSKTNGVYKETKCNQIIKY